LILNQESGSIKGLNAFDLASEFFPTASKPVREGTMQVKQIAVQRFSLTCSKRFEEVLAQLDSAIGHPEMAAFGRDMAAAKTSAELEAVVAKAVGSSGLMEFIRFDLGEVLRKYRADALKSVRLVVGNPLIMRQMVERVPDAGSYAPVTILVDERPYGVHLSYDRMASFLDGYQSTEALKVARELDNKVEALLVAASK
jgi:uncharacterized protein (DUF302 family)